ncbi:Centrosomal protein [Liparis tanakae]|uniref:Centrosomal protein n=1 Tax=Liparis tanakae TaxID=230148 RepID=A0A4Z2FER3_9TELE|nr:Centrosomal protein [Liparis tanakae]
MSLPPEKASELKQIIQDHLLKIDIHGRIREVLAESGGSDHGGSHGHLSEAECLHALQRRGIIEDVMRDIRFTQAFLSSSQADVDRSRRQLYVQVLGGKAFLEHLQEPEPLPGQVCSTLTLYLHFRNQRFRSKPVPCALEPDLKEGFVLEVYRDGECSKMPDATSMLSLCDPVHLVLIRTDTSGETALVSSYFLDWRAVLGAPGGKTCFAVELMGVGSECKVPAGVLTVSLELLPPLTETLSAAVISTQQSLERQRTAEKERLFLVYAKQWWREFLDIRPSNRSKMVKIFAQVGLNMKDDFLQTGTSGPVSSLGVNTRDVCLCVCNIYNKQLCLFLNIYIYTNTHIHTYMYV